MDQKQTTLTINLDQDSLNALSKMADQGQLSKEAMLLSLISKALREEGNRLKPLACDVSIVDKNLSSTEMSH